MNIFILIIIFIILVYLSKINKNKIIKNCPECKKYRLFTKMRLIHLNSLNFNFYNKNILEIGSKDTSFARFFLDKKSKITISSPLNSKIKKLKKANLNINIIKLNIDNPIIIPKFDFII